MKEKERAKAKNQSLRWCQWMSCWGLWFCTIGLVNSCSAHIKEPEAPGVKNAWVKKCKDPFLHSKLTRPTVGKPLQKLWQIYEPAADALQQDKYVCKYWFLCSGCKSDWIPLGSVQRWNPTIDDCDLWSWCQFTRVTYLCSPTWLFSIAAEFVDFCFEVSR